MYNSLYKRELRKAAKDKMRDLAHANCSNQQAADTADKIKNIFIKALSGIGEGGLLPSKVIANLSDDNILSKVSVGTAAARATVAGYSPLTEEADPSGIMEWLAQRAHPLCLPYIQENGDNGAHATMTFRHYDKAVALNAWQFGVMQPPQSSQEVVPDIVLVPMLAFDAACNRLGRGKGYYDRTIASLRMLHPVLTIGIALDAQRIEKVPVDAWDQVLDCIVTDIRIYYPK